MKELKSDHGPLQMKGKGIIYTFVLPPEETPKVGEDCVIDDKHFVVTGVERFWKLLDPPIPGTNVGLVVRKPVCLNGCGNVVEECKMVCSECRE